eukprot:7291969-Heterocapsa_arctica.AAC.1
MRSLSNKEKTEALAATGSQLAFMKVNRMMEAPDMAVAWQEVLVRGVRKDDKISPGQLTWVDPEIFAALLQKFLAGDTAGQAWQELTGENHSTGL